MSVIHLIRVEAEARRLIARARKVNRKAARARGENTPRLCTCRPCLTMWALRGLAAAAAVVAVYLTTGVVI